MDTDQSQYAKDTVTRLIELFQGTFGDYFKSYWEGTPTTPPPDTDFPLVIIQQKNLKAVIGPTSTDEVPETFFISVWLNMADDVGSENVRTTTMRKLQFLIQGQDPVTRDYKAGTFLFALRHYLSTLKSDEQFLIDSDVSVTYDQGHHSSLPTIAIADITLTTQRRVIVYRNG